MSGTEAEISLFDTPKLGQIKQTIQMAEYHKKYLRRCVFSLEFW